MLKQLTLCLLLFVLNTQLMAQEESNFSKLGASLKILLANDINTSPLITIQKGVKYLPVIIEYSNNSAAKEIHNANLAIRTQIGNIATADIAVADILNLIELPEIKRIELPLLFRKTDTTMKKMTTADKVLQGKSPLTMPYTGKNTVIGIIDDGIDFTHPDFINPKNESKILALWSMDYQRNPPNGFSYGTEWPKDSLEYYTTAYNNKLIGNYKMQNYFGYAFHGSAVAGLAAGNNGVAINADIVAVSLTAFADTLLRSDRMLDAITYIYGKAKKENKKCVINISLGIMEGGPHDGKTLVEKAIDNFCAEKNDILICTSAGNNGNTWKHWGGFPINKDSSFCFFRCAYQGSLYFSIPKQYTKDLSLSFTDSKLGNINSPNISRDSIIQQTPYVKIADLINNQGLITLNTTFPNNNPSSSFTFSASHYNDKYDELIVRVNEYSSTNTSMQEHLYRFIWKGEGTVHCWFPFWNLHPQYIFNNNPYPGDSTFRPSDNEYTTVIPTHAFTVLSSGAYNIRSCYINTIQKRVISQYEKCRTTYFTSHGPTLDGRIKPDIITPGENVMAPRGRFEDYLGHDFNVDSSTIAFGGTSASSPITAGIAALVWEKYPTFSREQVIDKIKTSSNFDDFCNTWGSKPNNVAGMGKADAFKALTGETTDNIELCKTMDVCIINIPIDTTNPANLEKDFITVYPNPVTNTLFVKYKAVNGAVLILFNAEGKKINEKMLLATATINTATFDVSMLPSGMYFVKFILQNNIITKKIIIMYY
jgi:subtilisin family serine protease